jgi:hypothetical protein
MAYGLYLNKAVFFFLIATKQKLLITEDWQSADYHCG